MAQQTNQIGDTNKMVTSVEWLVEKLDNNLDINHSWRTRQYIEQAKQMEKEQIEKAIDDALNAYGIIK